MTVDWTHAGPSMLAAFLASLVEFVEALTIVLAVGAVRGWRGALGGSGWPSWSCWASRRRWGRHSPASRSGPCASVLAACLLLFGMRWLRKAVLRAAGVIPLHDEEAVYAEQTAVLALGGRTRGWDRVAVSTAFKITMVEGIEVVFIVVAIGAGGGLLLPASFGAIAALLLVIALGFVLHKPVAGNPGERPEVCGGRPGLCFRDLLDRRRHGTGLAGRGLVDPRAEPRLPYGGAGRSAPQPAPDVAVRRVRSPVGCMSWFKTAWAECLGLFVDDGRLAAALLLWIAAAGLVLPRLGLPTAMPPLILFAGLAVILVESAARRARAGRDH